MKNKITCKAVEIKEVYKKRVAKGLADFIYEDIFQQIFAYINSPSVVINTKDDLIQAILSGKIYYDKGYFRGKFNNKLSSSLIELGAVWKNNGYFLSELPPEILQAVTMAARQANSVLKNIYDYLINFDIAQKIEDLTYYIKDAVLQAFTSLQRDLRKSLKEKKIPIIEDEYLSENPQADERLEEQVKRFEAYWDKTDTEANQLKNKLDELVSEQEQNQDYSKETQQKIKKARKDLKDFRRKQYKNSPLFDYGKFKNRNEQIANDYVYNMQFWVKKWRAKDIKIMRKDVLEMIENGARIEEIKKYFEKRWNIGKNKAQFLARNEFGLAQTAITKATYQELGSNSFVWKKSTSRCRRELHKKYYNKTFTYDKPPLIDERLQIYGLPKQIWNCECGIEPIFDLSKLKEKKGITKIVINALRKFNNNPYEYRRFTDREKI